MYVGVGAPVVEMSLTRFDSFLLAQPLGRPLGNVHSNGNESLEMQSKNVGAKVSQLAHLFQSRTGAGCKEEAPIASATTAPMGPPPAAAAVTAARKAPAREIHSENRETHPPHDHHHGVTVDSSSFPFSLLLPPSARMSGSPQ